MASASAAPPPSASTAPTAQTVIGLQNIGSIGHGACGGSSRVNLICGATANRPDPVVAVMLRSTADEKDTTTLQAQLRPRLRNCASTTAKRDPNLHGELTLQIAIDAHGGVTNVDVEGYSIDETTVQCMRSAARSTKFAEGAARRVRVVIRLQAS